MKLRFWNVISRVIVIVLLIWAVIVSLLLLATDATSSVPHEKLEQQRATVEAEDIVDFYFTQYSLEESIAKRASNELVIVTDKNYHIIINVIAEIVTEEDQVTVTFRATSGEKVLVVRTVKDGTTVEVLLVNLDYDVPEA